MTIEAIASEQPFVMDTAFWTATAIFIIAYAIIVSERVHKTVVAIFAASLMIVLMILEQHEAFHVAELGVDWNVIFLLISMMVIGNLIYEGVKRIDNWTRIRNEMPGADSHRFI